MHYVIEITSNQFTKIQGIIRTGTYESLQQFVEVAIENQLGLERETLGSVLSRIATSKKGSNLEAEIRGYSLEYGRTDNLLLIPTKETPAAEESTQPREQTIWGLYNRVFPMKIALRVLSNLATEIGTEYIPLAQVQGEASKRARILGRLLVDDDERAARPHGEKLSTGLPIGPQEKTSDRYKTMFVGSISSNAQPRGMAFALGFVNFRIGERNHPAIALTKSGADFARLHNPILDSTMRMYDTSLSEEEGDHYLTHVRTWMPVEWELYQDVLRSISKGSDSPDELNLVVKKRLLNLDGGELSTERAGIISRLTELGLVRRERKGLEVRCLLTPRGEQYIRRKGKNT